MSKHVLIHIADLPPSPFGQYPLNHARCASAVSLSNFIIRGDMRTYYRQRREAGHRAGQEFLHRNKGADRAWLGGFLDVSLPKAQCLFGASPPNNRHRHS